MLHPIGQESQIPVEPRGVRERMKDRPTLMIRSEKVPIMKAFISPPPLKTPSVTSFSETTK